MKPAEYIRQKQAQKPKKFLKESNLPPITKKYLADTGEDISQYLAKMNQSDFGTMLVSHLKLRLPSFFREMFDKGFIAIGEINDPLPNAYTKELADEGFAILFYTGLKDFIYRIARALSTRISEREHPELVSFHETCRIIAEIIWWYQESEQAFGPQYPVTNTQIYFASQLSVEAESFLVAHELGHIIQHLTQQPIQIFPEIEKELEGVSVNHKEEFYSDALGVSLVLGLRADEDKIQPIDPITYAGVEFVFQIFRAMEFLGFDFAQTHPPAVDRLNFVRNIVKPICATEADWKNLTNYSKVLDVVFENIIAVICDPDKHEDFYQRAATELVNKLDNLLDRCTGGMVPDYVTFYSEVVDIFEQGYSHRLLEETANATVRFFEHIQQIQDNEDEAVKQEAWVAFQKYKLFFGFIDQMSEPARSIFKSAL